MSSSLLVGRADTNADAGADGNALNLSVRVALQEHVGSRFQFTYRLVHPSGYIQWLGTQDGNGVIQVEAGIPGIHLSQQWQVHEDGKYHLPALPHDAILVRVEDLEDWTVWVWNKSRYAPFSRTHRGFANTIALQLSSPVRTFGGH